MARKPKGAWHIHSNQTRSSPKRKRKGGKRVERGKEPAGNIIGGKGGPGQGGEGGAKGPRRTVNSRIHMTQPRRRTSTSPEHIAQTARASSVYGCRSGLKTEVGSGLKTEVGTPPPGRCCHPRCPLLGPRCAVQSQAGMRHKCPEENVCAPIAPSSCTCVACAANHRQMRRFHSKLQTITHRYPSNKSAPE